MNLNHRVIICLIVTAAFLILPCACSKNEVNKNNSVEFQVDSLKLGFMYQDSTAGFQFYLPEKWTKQPQSYLEAINKAAKQQKEKINQKVKGIFVNEGEQSFCFISAYEGVDSLDSIITSINRELLNIESSDIQRATFRHNNLEFQQWRITDKSKVSFRLLLQTKKKNIVQVDYILPIEISIKKIKNIEASIGTIENSKKR